MQRLSGGEALQTNPLSFTLPGAAKQNVSAPLRGKQTFTVAARAGTLGGVITVKAAESEKDIKFSPSPVTQVGDFAVLGLLSHTVLWQ